MRILKTLIPLLTSALLLSSCESMPKSWKWGIKPRPLTGIRNFPSTDTYYGKGFKSGCAVAWDSVGYGLMSDMNNLNKTQIHPELMGKNPDYASGWWDGFEQCTYIIDWDVV